MAKSTVTIRELRTDFRSVKRKLEEFGEVIVTDRGEPAYELKPLSKKSPEPQKVTDYYARLLEQRPLPMSLKETQNFWEDERGER